MEIDPSFIEIHCDVVSRHINELIQNDAKITLLKDFALDLFASLECLASIDKKLLNNRSICLIRTVFFQINELYFWQYLSPDFEKFTIRTAQCKRHGDGLESKSSKKPREYIKSRKRKFADRST